MGKKGRKAAERDDEGAWRRDAKPRLARLAITYWILGHQAHVWRTAPVSGNIMHLAVEMILKALLVERVGLDALKDEYGHSLPLLWAGVLEAHPELACADTATMIERLHRYEHIRYPDVLMERGGILMTSSAPGRLSQVTDDVAFMSTYDVDTLMRRALRKLSLNPPVVVLPVDPEFVEVLEEHLREPGDEWAA